MRVTFLIPAHNEQDRIAAAIRSIRAQTVQPDRIVVIADRCTDATERIAWRQGAIVLRTAHNRTKKAGALNQAWRLLELAALLGDDDCVFVMDADSILDRRFVEHALQRLEAEPELAACGGTFRGAPGGGFVGMLQRNEYARYARDVRRRKGRVLVLTGTATVFKVRALRDVIAARLAGQLPAGTPR